MRSKMVMLATGLVGGTAALIALQPLAASHPQHNSKSVSNNDGWVSVRYNDDAMVEGSGTLASEMRTVGRFDEIEIRDATNLHIRQGRETSLKISTDDNLLGNIRTTTEGGRLLIDSKGSYRTRLGIVAELVVPSLSEVQVMGSGDIRFKDWNGEAIRLSIRGSGDIVLDGSVEEVQAIIQGSGDIDLRTASAQTVDARVQGSGDILTGAPQRLAAVVQGSGDIRYSGNPEFSRRQVYGTGDITRN